MFQSTSTSTKRRLLSAALLLTVSSVTGCSSTGPSLASLNPFAKTTPADVPAAPTAETGGGISGSLSNLAQGTRAQASSMGMAVKSAYGKGRDTITGLVSGGKSETVRDVETGEEIASSDPLLLNNKPESVGAEVFVANGQLWETSGNFPRAMDSYSKALEREPSNAAALASVARLHYRQNNFEQSVEYFQRAIKSSPNEAGLYNDCGLALSKLKRHDEAITMIDRAIAIAPTTSRYANNLATVQFEAGHEDAARDILLKHNTPVVAHYNMAYLLYSSNRTDKALEELGQALSKADPNATDSATQKAIAKSKEMFEQLGGPTTRIAQSLPQFYGAVKQSGAAVSQLATDAKAVVGQVQTAAAGATGQLTDSATAVANATTVPAVAAPTVTQPPTGTSNFTLPPQFAIPATPKVAEQPNTATGKY